jgi:hypothetical protein
MSASSDPNDPPALSAAARVATTVEGSRWISTCSVPAP